MRQERGLQTAVIAVLAVAILVMSVGFALFNQSLNIQGTATFTAAKWDVHFDTTSFVEDSAPAVTASPTPTPSGTTLSYAVTLAKPGDQYQFHINVINEGTIDAVLKSITITNDQSTASYIKHTVTYDGSPFTATTSTIPAGIATLSKQTGNTPGSKTVTVTVKYDDSPEVQGSLPASGDVTAHLNVTLYYESA